MELEYLNEGNQYFTSEIEGIFDTNFYSIIPHINIRRDEENKRYLILFVRDDGHYDHEMSDEYIRLIGSGMEGDQSVEDNRNRVLIDAIENPIPIYLFYRELDYEVELWDYKGTVRVRNYDVEEIEGRDVIVFQLVYDALDVTIAENVERSGYPDVSKEDVVWERELLDNEILGEPKVREGIDYSENRRIARDYAFREIVISAYDNRCAICGSSRCSPDGYPEVDAAHIFPKKEGGSDDPRNGISLCKFHHWGYDSGWLAISVDYRLRVRDLPKREAYDDFIDFEGEQLHLPANEQYSPHRKFIEAELSRRKFF